MKKKMSIHRTTDRVPIKLKYFCSIDEQVKSTTKMNVKFNIWITVLLGITNVTLSSPTNKERFFMDSVPKGITISRVTSHENAPQTTTSYSIKFVPLITLLAGMFPNFISKLGQFTGVNKYVNIRRFDVADPLPLEQNATKLPLEDEFETDDDDEEEEEGESELIECDRTHLGLWPDKSDNQRYYKCEVDPRTSGNANCIKDYFEGKQMINHEVVPIERIQVPGVKPCFLLSMMKCANGFKYSHKTRICVPDIVFGALPKS